MSEETNALDIFGKYLMQQARDYAIKDADAIFKDNTESSFFRKLNDWIDATFDESDRQLYHYLVPFIVDTVLHHVLLSLETADWIKVSIQADSEVVPDIRELADGGLEGELSDWIENYSKQRYDYIDDL